MPTWKGFAGLHPIYQNDPVKEVLLAWNHCVDEETGYRESGHPAERARALRGDLGANQITQTFTEQKWNGGKNVFGADADGWAESLKTTGRNAPRVIGKHPSCIVFTGGATGHRTGLRKDMDTQFKFFPDLFHC